MDIKQIKKIKVKTMPHDQAYLPAEKKIEEARLDKSIRGKILIIEGASNV